MQAMTIKRFSISINRLGAAAVVGGLLAIGLAGAATLDTPATDSAARVSVAQQAPRIAESSSFQFLDENTYLPSGSVASVPMTLDHYRFLDSNILLPGMVTVERVHLDHLRFIADNTWLPGSGDAGMPVPTFSATGPGGAY